MENNLATCFSCDFGGQRAVNRQTFEYQSADGAVADTCTFIWKDNMPQFMLVYRGGCEGMKHASPDQIQQVMQMWMDWIQGGIEAGWMVDGGNGLKPGGALVHSDLSLTDGPFAESKELVGGYSMVEAFDLPGAIELAKGSPILTSGGTVEVRELSHSGKRS